MLFTNSLDKPPRLCGWELKRFYRCRVITAHWSKAEQCRRLIKGVNQKNFGSFFTTCSDMQTAQLIVKTVRWDKSMLRIILSKVVTVHAIRRKVTWSQNSFYKSAITSRAWPQPIPGVFLIPSALLVVADLLWKMVGRQTAQGVYIENLYCYVIFLWTFF